jgi:hypothetical protein
VNVAFFGRRELPPGSDEQPDDEPMDDAVDFDLSRRQEHLRKSGKAHTRRAMERVWAQMQARWARDRYRYLDERTGKVTP